MKVAFGIPHAGDNFQFPYLNSAIGMCLEQAALPPDERILGSVIPAGGPYVDDNRTAISIQFLSKTDEDWLLMVDPDIEFQTDILKRFKLIIEQYPEVKILAGRVNLLNGLPVFYYIKGDANVHYCYPFDGVKTFDKVGTGIIFIHRDVFVNIRMNLQNHHHFFSRVLREDGMLYGDDFSFCLRAKATGFKLHGHWEIVGKHFKAHECFNQYPDKDRVEIRIK